MASGQVESARRRLEEAAAPYGLRAERTRHSALPDLVLVRVSEGRPMARLRFVEDDRGPAIRSVYPPDVSSAEEAEIEAHIARRMTSVLAEVFSYAVWMSLPDPPRAD